METLLIWIGLIQKQARAILENEYWKREELELELGDVLYSLIVLSNKLDVDLEEALDIVLIKYQRRLLKGSAGSEVDNK